VGNVTRISFYPRKKFPVPIEHEVGMHPKPVWTLWRKVLCFFRDSNPGLFSPQPSHYPDCTYSDKGDKVLGHPIVYGKKDEEVKEKMMGRGSKLGKERKKFSEKLEINLPIGLISLYTCAVHTHTHAHAHAHTRRSIYKSSVLSF
jgi:hypothetical protein